MASLNAVVDVLMPEWPVLTSEDRDVVREHCVRFVRDELAVAPAHIRSGFWALHGTLAVLAMFFGGGPRGHVAALAVLSGRDFAIFGGVERLLRSLTVVGFLEHPTVTAALEQERVADFPRRP